MLHSFFKVLYSNRHSIISVHHFISMQQTISMDTFLGLHSHPVKSARERVVSRVSCNTSASKLMSGSISNIIQLPKTTKICNVCFPVYIQNRIALCRHNDFLVFFSHVGSMPTELRLWHCITMICAYCKSLLTGHTNYIFNQHPKVSIFYCIYIYIYIYIYI